MSIVLDASSHGTKHLDNEEQRTRQIKTLYSTGHTGPLTPVMFAFQGHCMALAMLHMAM